MREARPSDPVVQGLALACRKMLLFTGRAHHDLHHRRIELRRVTIPAGRTGRGDRATSQRRIDNGLRALGCDVA